MASGINDDDGALEIPSAAISEFTARFGHVIPKVIDQLPYNKSGVIHD
ncbi:hypothetical protein SynTAK9802_01374 [Synechococcus sp. TAK9802]|nr:hypothetical protein SynTAK9802_01374 [Synechococcus sp. TAK9802]